jgi:hypothetical protein
MSSDTAKLHQAFLDALGDLVASHSEIKNKPLEIDLKLPLPPRLRLYIYSLAGGVLTKHGTRSKRPNEFKASLRVPGQRVGDYGSFDHGGGRLVLLVGYRADLDVFVLWDATLQGRFKNGGNIQVRQDTVLTAAALGEFEQLRKHTIAGQYEAVLACNSANLAATINRRIALIGGLDEREIPK